MEEEFLGALYKGGELLAAGKIVEAREHLEKAHGLSPKNEKAQNLLGLTYFKLGLFDQASEVYEKLVNENPTDATLRVNLGLVYLKTNNLERCIKEFETATDLEPTHKKAHNYLGLALAQQGTYAKAKEHFELAGSDQMAEKMARALSAQSSPSGIQSAPPVAKAPVNVVLGEESEAPPPLPASKPKAAAAEEEPIEVMSDEEAPSDAYVVPEETTPPAPAASAPPLEKDWGAQASAPAPAVAGSDDMRFAEDEGPSEASLQAAPVEEMPVVDAVVEATPAETTSEPPARETPAWLTMEAAEANRAGPTPAEAATWVTESVNEVPLPLEGAAQPEVVPVSNDSAWAQTAPATEGDAQWSSEQTAPAPAAEDPASAAGAQAPAADDASWATGAAPAADDPAWAAGTPAAPAADDAAWATGAATAPAADDASWATGAATAPAADEAAYATAPAADDPSWATGAATAPAVDETAYATAPAADDASWATGAATAPAADDAAWATGAQTAAPAADDASWATGAATTAEAAPAADDSSWATGPATAPAADDASWATGATTPAEPPAPEPSAPLPITVVEPEEAPRATTPPAAPAGYAPMQPQRLVDLGASGNWVSEPTAGPFHLSSDGLAVTVGGEMLTRMVGLVAIVGSVEVTPENKRRRGRSSTDTFGAGPSQLQRVKGHGVLYLEPGRSRFHAVDLTDQGGVKVDDDGAFLREELVFAFEETISFDNGRLTSDAQLLELVHLKGNGRVLLQLDGSLRAMPIPLGAPMVVPLKRLVGWFGRVSPRLMGFGGQGAVELTGEGYALLGTPGEGR